MKRILSEIGEHIVNGIKFTLPLIVVYSVFSAIVNAGYIDISIDLNNYVFLVLVPILTAFLVNSIKKYILFIPGLILGYIVADWGLGYLGGIIGGLILGYSATFILDKVHIKHEMLNKVFRYIFVGLISFGFTYLVMFILIKVPLRGLLDYVAHLIYYMDKDKTFLVVIVLSSLTVLDLGGPFNKIAYSFIIQFYTEGFYHIIGPVLVSVMMPPLAVFLALYLMRNRFNDKDYSSRYIALIGGLFGLTEGALLVGYRRPLKVIPILILGSVSASLVASLLHLTNNSLLVGLPSFLTINSIFAYLLSVLIGLFIILGLFLLVLPKEKNTTIS